jgi:hypothetical protein
MSHPRYHLAVAVALACASTLCTAEAQALPPEANNPAVKAAISACTGDAQKLCAGVVPGGGRIVRCLAAKQSELTPACRDSMLNAKAALGR